MEIISGIASIGLTNQYLAFANVGFKKNVYAVTGRESSLFELIEADLTQQVSEFRSSCVIFEY